MGPTMTAWQALGWAILVVPLGAFFLWLWRDAAREFGGLTVALFFSIVAVAVAVAVALIMAAVGLILGEIP